MREIIDDKGQFNLDLEDKKEIESMPPKEEEPMTTVGGVQVEVNKKGRKIPHCPRCGGILHAGAPCEK